VHLARSGQKKGVIVLFVKRKVAAGIFPVEKKKTESEISDLGGGNGGGGRESKGRSLG